MAQVLFEIDLVIYDAEFEVISLLVIERRTAGKKFEEHDAERPAVYFLSRVR